MSMISRYIFGTPLPTMAVIREIAPSGGEIPHFTVTKADGSVSFTTILGDDDLIFGLGENVRGINKRGHLYRAWNMDDFSHTENKGGIYSSHNLLLFSGEQGVFGAYFDDPGTVTFDLGYSDGGKAVITSENGNLSVYLIESTTLTGLVREFRHLIGRSYIPPKWAMGYIQSRWGYASEDDLDFIVSEHRKRHIPLDNVCMDIDYMEDFKDFTWNPVHFPDLKATNARMKDEHIHLVPIIDAGIKQLTGDPIYDEGVQKDYFVKKADGSLFVGAVWPGRACFPDFLREDVRQWFGAKYHKLMDTGIEGFWNDMNEPALFYSTDSLENAFETAEKMRHENLGIDGAFKLKDAFVNIANNAEDYRRFYHTVDGQPVRHDKVHNLYGAMMTKSAAEGFRSYNPDRRYLLFSRSSFIGAHRDGGVWQGDNSSWWSHLLLNLKMMPSLNMCGFLYTGADLGGFSCNTTEDLLLRWLALGVFTPLMRNHTAQHTRDQEIFRFRNWEDMRNVVSVRYALLPYLYSLLVKCACRDEMMFRPLAFDYPQDKTAIRVEDQLMLGDECMIAPVVEQNARGRHVYLPEDMLLVRFRSGDDYTVQTMQKGHHWLDVPMNEVPLFIRRGHVIPLCRSAEYVDALDTTKLSLVGWLEVGCAITLYEDDGESTDIDLNEGLQLINVSIDKGVATAKCAGKTIDASKVVVWER